MVQSQKHRCLPNQARPRGIRISQLGTHILGSRKVLDVLGHDSREVIPAAFDLTEKNA